MALGQRISRQSANPRSSLNRTELLPWAYDHRNFLGNGIDCFGCRTSPEEWSPIHSKLLL